MGFVSEPSLAAPPLGATAAAGASACAAAAPPPASTCSWVESRNLRLPPRPWGQGPRQVPRHAPRRSATGVTVHGLSLGTFACHPALGGKGRGAIRRRFGVTTAGAAAGPPAVPPPAPRSWVCRNLRLLPRPAAPCRHRDKRPVALVAWRAVRVRVPAPPGPATSSCRLIIRARACAAFHGASAAASACAHASSAFRPRSPRCAFAPQRLHRALGPVAASTELPRGLPLRSGPSRPPGRSPVAGCCRGPAPASRQWRPGRRWAGTGL